MSRHGAVELDFADGTYTFRLGLSEIEEVEERAGRGIFLIADDLDPKVRAARLKTISSVIRVGLIGGGKPPAEALSLVRRYVDSRPLHESLLVAYTIVMAALARVKSEDVPKDDSEGKPEAAETDEPTSPPSTPPPS